MWNNRKRRSDVSFLLLPVADNVIYIEVLVKTGCKNDY